MLEFILKHFDGILLSLSQVWDILDPLNEPHEKSVPQEKIWVYFKVYFAHSDITVVYDKLFVILIFYVKCIWNNSGNIELWGN